MRGRSLHYVWFVLILAAMGVAGKLFAWMDKPVLIPTSNPEHNGKPLEEPGQIMRLVFVLTINWGMLCAGLWLLLVKWPDFASSLLHHEWFLAAFAAFYPVFDQHAARMGASEDLFRRIVPGQVAFFWCYLALGAVSAYRAGSRHSPARQHVSAWRMLIGLGAAAAMAGAFWLAFVFDLTFFWRYPIIFLPACGIMIMVLYFAFGLGCSLRLLRQRYWPAGVIR